MKLILLLLAIVVGNSVAQILNLDSNCGKGTALRRKRIIGGTVAVTGHHGWQAILYSNGVMKCGASLINEYWVLTAASCLYQNLNPSSYTLEFGIQDRNANWNISKNKRRKAKKIFIHPSYDNFYIRNDIALIKLDSSVSTITSNYGIVPVCVPDGKENYQNRYGYATGFGSFKIDGSNTSAVKLQVNLPILSDSQCKSKFSSQVDTYSQVCAGNNGQNRDTCAKDTGGPLVARGNNGRWHLVGITSWGRNPCGNGGVYTRVSAYAAFIDETIKRN